VLSAIRFPRRGTRPRFGRSSFSTRQRPSTFSRIGVTHETHSYFCNPGRRLRRAQLCPHCNPDFPSFQWSHDHYV
jgi:hypothetical protein